MCFLARKIYLNEPALSPAGLLTWRQKSEQGEAFPKAQSKGHRGKAVEYEVWSVSERLVLGLIFLLLYFKYLCRRGGQHKQSLDHWCSHLCTVPGEQEAGKLGRDAFFLLELVCLTLSLPVSYFLYLICSFGQKKKSSLCISLLNISPNHSAYRANSSSFHQIFLRIVLFHP